MSSVIKPYIDLCRISNLPTVWTNVLAAMVLAGAAFSGLHFLILALSMSLLYSGGMCLNDICDAESDKEKKSSRPIPSGQVLIKDAYMLTITLFLTGLVLLFLVPYRVAVIAGFFLLAVIVLYDLFHRSHPWSVVLMAACRLLVFVVAAFAVSGRIGQLVIIAGIAQFLYTFAISLVARYENKSKMPLNRPVIPLMIACISLVDGILLALLVSPFWLAAGAAGAILTLYGQKFVRGD